MAHGDQGGVNAADGDTIDESRRRAEAINAADVPAAGCLAGGARIAQGRPPEDLLKSRPKWAPLRRTRAQMGHTCSSTDGPFCTALSQREAARFGPQYITLQKCGRNPDTGFTVDAVATCAVLVVGAGGLGSPLLMYLAAAGVGRRKPPVGGIHASVGIIGIVDGDQVELSNLHRQIVHDEENEGMNKAISARRRLAKINSHGNYIAYDRFFGQQEAETLVPQYDVVVDATDNPQTRYLINDACVKFKKTLVIASSIGTQGQLMVFNRVHERAETPCYRCIAPLEGNPFVSVRRGACSFAGVLGSIPGVIGALQATEVLKIAAGVHEAVLGDGRMLLYDTTNTTRPFRCVQLKRNDNCTVCGSHAPEISLSAQMMPWQTCNVNCQVDDTAIGNDTFWRMYMGNIKNGMPVVAKVREGDQMIQHHADGEERVVCLVDVRPKEHYALCHLAGATNWPVADLLDYVALRDEEAEERGRTGQSICDDVIQRCTGHDTHKKVLLLFICFLGNSSRTATTALRDAIKRHAADGDKQRVTCYSVAGGCRAIRMKLGIDMPLS